MRLSRFSRFLLVLASLTALAFCPSIQAQAVAGFTLVADDSQPPFQGHGFGTYPSISDDGTVAFVVEQVGTFRAEPGKTPVLVGGGVTGDPFINRLGEIASRQYVSADLTTELYKATPDGQIVPLVRNDGEFRQFGLPIHLSPTGTAVFWARKNPVSPGHWGIFTATGDGAPSLVVDNKGEFNVFGGSPTINSAGTVAFAGSKDVINNTSENGLYLGAAGGNGATTTLLTAAASPLYNFDGGPYINDKGEIAFKAYEDNTGEPGILVINQDGTNLRTVATAGGTEPYSMFESPIINERGTVVFFANLDTGGRGIYAGPDPVADEIIRVGKPLFGSTATSIGFLRGLNNRNEVVFYFSLADGRSGIAKATLNAPKSYADSAQLYHLVDLGVPPGQQMFSPAAINNQGQITGSSERFAFRYTNGVWENLGTLPGGNLSGGKAINDFGEIAGSSQYTNGGGIVHATLFSGGAVADLGTLPEWGNYSTGAGINDSRQVAGYSGSNLSTTYTHAFLWDPATGFRDLGTLGGQYAKAFSVNDSGTVTGTAQIGTGFGNFHAFVWDQANGMRDLGTIAGDISSGTFINANGHIAGNSTVNNFDNRSHAFIYDTAMHDLGSLGSDGYESDRSAAFGINIHDEVVGTSYRPFAGGALYQVAFVYRDGTMFDLETTVDNPDYRLYSAVSINDAGQILVQAIHVPTNTNRAVLLTPAGVPFSTPPPTPSPTATPTATATATPDPTPTPTSTPPASPTPFPSASPSGTPASTPVPTATPTFSPSATPSPSASPTSAPASTVAAQPLNIATRGRIGAGDNAMIGGFIITGSAAKKVIVRAIGPALQRSLPGAVSDPVLQLRGPDGSLIRQNDNWGDDASQASAIEANHVAPGNELESAVVETLAPGSYTAAVTGKNGASGVGLIEVYDLDQGGASKLGNISTRGVVQSAENVLIGGFILGGADNNTQVLLRAIGPSLGNVGVADALSNPTLELRDGNGVLLRANDDWKDQQQTAIEQTGISPNDSSESAILADLAPGAYTAIVGGKDGAAGTGLIEIYNLR